VTTYYTSNDPTVGFDATTAGTLPGDWANKAGTWQVGTTNPVGSHARSFASSTDADGDVALVTGISAVADMQVAYTQVLPGGVSGAAQPILAPILRCDAGYNNCYTCVITVASSGHLSYMLFKRVSGGYSVAGTGSSPQSFATSGAITLNVVAQIAGTSSASRPGRRHHRALGLGLDDHRRLDLRRGLCRPLQRDGRRHRCAGGG